MRLSEYAAAVNLLPLLFQTKLSLSFHMKRLAEIMPATVKSAHVHANESDMRSTLRSEEDWAQQARIIITNGSTAAEILSGLYRARKATDAKYSLAFICKKAGIPSTGYLSDVLKGKKQLHRKYASAIVRAFSLKASAARFVRLKIERDEANDPSVIERLEAKLAILKKDLQVASRPMSPKLSGVLSALEVFCAFGLFDNHPTRKNLLSYFGKRAADHVDNALAILLEMRLIREQRRNHFCLLVEQVRFHEDEAEFSHIEFLKQAIGHAAQNVDAWYQRASHSLFESSIISVNQASYLSQLDDLKGRISIAQSELEAGNADMLIRFNVQIYPVLVPPVTELDSSGW